MSSPATSLSRTPKGKEDQHNPTSQNIPAGSDQPIDKPNPRTRLPNAPLKPRPVIRKEEITRKKPTKPPVSKPKSKPKTPTASGTTSKSRKRKRENSLPRVPLNPNNSENNSEGTQTPVTPLATSPRRRSSARLQEQSPSITPSRPSASSKKPEVPISPLSTPSPPPTSEYIQTPKPKRKRGPKTTGEIEEWLQRDKPPDIYSALPRRPSYPTAWLDSLPPKVAKSPPRKPRKRRTTEQLQEARRIKEEKAVGKKEAKRIKAEAAAAKADAQRIEKERLQKMKEEAEAWRKRDADAEWRRKEWVRMDVSRDERERNEGRKWHKATKDFLDDETGKVPFPIPWKGKEGCKKGGCVRGELMGVCCHDVERVLREGAGVVYDEGYLRKERLRWHPDRFTGRGDVQVMAQEMFQMIQRLIDGPGRPGGT